jgi:hypothetical protein
MKIILLLAALLALTTAPLCAQSILENGDFSDGTNHWHGDVKPAGSDSTTDLLTSQNDAKGVLVELRSHNWTKVTQEIHDLKDVQPNSGVDLTIEYTVSTDFKLSDDVRSNYGGLAKLDFPNARIPEQQGSIITFIDVQPAVRATAQNSGYDSTSNSNVLTVTVHPDDVGYAYLTPDTTAGTHTFTSTMWLPVPKTDDLPVFCIAVPPGEGSITISKITTSPHAGPVQPQQNQGGYSNFSQPAAYPGGYPGNVPRPQYPQTPNQYPGNLPRPQNPPPQNQSPLGQPNQ